jgi:hypothetical protein
VAQVVLVLVVLSVLQHQAETAAQAVAQAQAVVLELL